MSCGMDLRILLVEDDPSTTFAIRSFFESRGVITEHAATVEEACRLLRIKSYDGIVTDLRLSDDSAVGGLQVAELAHEIQPGSRVVMVTAYATRSLERETRGRGIHRLLRKPVGLEELAAAVLPPV